MATKGTLNVVCHGTIAFIVQDDGSVELRMPKVDPVWNHRYEAGTWAGNLESLDPGSVYELTGVQPGDQKQRFDPSVNICIETAVAPPGANIRRILLPPAKSISAANFFPLVPGETFENPDQPPVKELSRMAGLNVLSYDCDDLESVLLKVQGSEGSVNWTPRIVKDADGNSAVNLHVFAEPWTFRPLATKPFPESSTLPFNALIESTGATDLRMKSPGKSGGSFASAIDPGHPIAGLPEPEKLPLSQRAAYKRAGALATKPYNCGGLVHQGLPPKQMRPLPAAAKAFALVRNQNPKVISNPRVAVVYWGANAPDANVDAKIQQLLKLPFIVTALQEHGVSAPEFAGSFPYPAGDPQQINDAHTFPANVGDSDIAHGLAELIQSNKAADPNLLYLVVPDQGAHSDTPGVQGGHNYFYPDTAGEKVSVRYGWAVWGQPDSADGLTPIDHLTWTLSHEFLEACTNPEPPNGWVFEGPEICDVAAGLHAAVDGLVVTGYFSHKDGRYKQAEGAAGVAQ